MRQPRPAFPTRRRAGLPGLAGSRPNAGHTRRTRCDTWVPRGKKAAGAIRPVGAPARQTPRITSLDTRQYRTPCGVNAMRTNFIRGPPLNGSRYVIAVWRRAERSHSKPRHQRARQQRKRGLVVIAGEKRFKQAIQNSFAVLQPPAPVVQECKAEWRVRL